MNVFLNYFVTVNLFNLLYSLIIGFLFSSSTYIPICFATMGTIIGYWSFNYHFSFQYYFYYNIGYSKRHLIINVWKFNIIIAIITYSLLKL